MKTSEVGLDLIKNREAFREFAYPDPYSPLGRATRKQRWGFRPADEILETLPAEVRKLDPSPWTVGYGEATGITRKDRRSRQEAEAYLLRKLTRYEALVERACTRRPTQLQFDALVALAWNIEAAVNPRTSTIIKCHNAGDFEGAARAFRLYNNVTNKATGKKEKSAGLTRFREEEALVYLRGSTKREEVAEKGTFEDLPPEPLEPAPERPLSQSQITRASTVAGISAAGAAASEISRTVADVRYGIEGLGDFLVPVLLIAVVALCGYIIYQRYQQRKQGWA